MPRSALHLQSQPKNMPLMQADHLLKGNGGFQHQLPSRERQDQSMLPAHGSNRAGQSARS